MHGDTLPVFAEKNFASLKFFWGRIFSVKKVLIEKTFSQRKKLNFFNHYKPGFN